MSAEQGEGISNCLIYALMKYCREGGYILIRKSDLGWWPHFLHGTRPAAGDVTVSHFVPLQPFKARGLFRFFPIHTLLFRGRVRSEDCSRVEDYKQG